MQRTSDFTPDGLSPAQPRRQTRPSLRVLKAALLAMSSVVIAYLLVATLGGTVRAQGWLVNSAGPDGVLYRAALIKETLSLDSFDGVATLEIQSDYVGPAADRIWSWLGSSTSSERRRALLERWLPRYPMSDFSEDPVLSRNAAGTRVSIVERLRVPRHAVVLRGGWRLDYTPANLVLALPKLTELGQAPAAGTEWRYNFEVSLPKEVSAQRPALQRRLAGSFFEWEVISQFKDNKATELHRLKWVAAPSSVEERARYQQDLAALDRQRRDVFVSRSMLAGATPVDTDQAIIEQGAGFEQRVRPALEARFNQAARLLQQNVPLVERADLLLYRSESALTLGRFDNAFADANEALRLQPNNPRAMRSRGMVLLLRGEFDLAAQEFGKALRMPDAQRVPGLVLELQYRRGQAFLLSNRPADAAVELQAALVSLSQAVAVAAAAPKPEDGSSEPPMGNRGHFLRAWLLAAWQRQGVAPDENVRKTFSAQATGAWPEPLVGLFLDQVSPEALVQLADELQGDYRLMGYCEGQFFIGLKAYLPRGNTPRTDASKAAAKAAFEAALRTRAFPLLEYRLAEVLLKGL